jgi:hypothetical protein
MELWLALLKYRNLSFNFGIENIFLGIEVSSVIILYFNQSTRVIIVP